MKTNAMRILDSNEISYKTHEYIKTNLIKGKDVAKYLLEDEQQVFKTLVTIGKSKTNYVFVIPVSKELDLKKAAIFVNEKSIEMIKQKDLLPLTGYVHGGCSPLGMKKAFKTIFDKSVYDYETIIFSGGKIGYQIEVSFLKIETIFNFATADLVK